MADSSEIAAKLDPTKSIVSTDSSVVQDFPTISQQCEQLVHFEVKASDVVEILLLQNASRSTSSQ